MMLRQARRKNGSARPITLSKRQLQLAHRLDSGDMELNEWVQALEASRPRTRGECRGMGLRPCPFVSCRYHLYLDVNEANGSVKLNFPHLEPWELDVSCSLDVAEEGGLTLEEVGNRLNLTRERIRQFTDSAQRHLRSVASVHGLTPADARGLG